MGTITMTYLVFESDDFVTAVCNEALLSSDLYKNCKPQYNIYNFCHFFSLLSILVKHSSIHFTSLILKTEIKKSWIYHFEIITEQEHKSTGESLHTHLTFSTKIWQFSDRFAMLGCRVPWSITMPVNTGIS